MASKKKSIRCGVCGALATHSISSIDHVCDNPACETLTREHIRQVVAQGKEQEQQEKFWEGAQV